MADRYQLFNRFSAAADAPVNALIIRAGRIRRVDFVVSARMTAVDDNFGVEVSLQNVYQGNSNGAQGVLGLVGQYLGGTFAQGAFTSGILHGFDVDVPVVPLDRIYLNAGLFAYTNGTFPPHVAALAFVTVV